MIHGDGEDDDGDDDGDGLMILILMTLVARMALMTVMILMVLVFDYHDDTDVFQWCCQMDCLWGLKPPSNNLTKAVHNS